MRILGSVYKKFFPKPGVSMLVNYPKFQAKDTMLTCTGKTGNALEADLGTAALQISDILYRNFSGAKKQVDDIFAGITDVLYIQNRAKSALSIHAKIKRGVKEGSVNSFETAQNFVLDGIGSRIISKSLDKLDDSRITKMIDELKVDNKSLSQEQKTLLRKYISCQELSPEQEAEIFPLYEKFARPLIEKRSQPVVDSLLLSITKHRMIGEGLTIDEIKSKGLLTEDLLRRLEKEDIVPLEITLMNNYRGFHGLPEFSGRQIQAIRKVTDNKIIIRSRPDLADYKKFPNEGYTKDEIRDFALKASGYRTAQANVIHSNGMLGELQFRGDLTNKFAEYEHIAYDLREGKNTLGPIFDDYKSAISKLSDKDYNDYNLYLEKYYNYFNRLELGLPAVKPNLPDKFNRVLSVESLKNLHDQNEIILADAGKDFIAHFEAFA